MILRSGQVATSGVVGLLVSCLLALSAFGQDASDPNAIPTPASLETRRAEIEADPAIEAELKAKLLERYRAAIREANRIAELRASSEQFKQDAETAPARVAKLTEELRTIDAELQRLRGNEVDPEFLDKSVAELTAMQSARVAQAAALKQQLQDISNRIQQRTDRRKAIDQFQAEADAQQVKLEEQLSAPPGDVPPELAEINKLLARLQLIAHQLTRTSYGFELAKYTAEESVGLLRHSGELLQKRIEVEEEIAARIAARIREINAAGAKSMELQTLSQARQKGPLQAEAEFNTEYANEFRRYLVKIEGVDRERKHAEAELESQQEDFESVRRIEGQVGLTTALGLLLREQRSKLPNLNELNRRIDRRMELIEETQEKSWLYERELGTLPTPMELIQEVAEKSGDKAAFRRLSQDENAALLRQAKQILETRALLLRELRLRSKDYFQVLTEADSVDQRLVAHTQAYLQYINERILWTRSAEVLTPKLMAEDTSTWEWMVDRENWSRIPNRLLGETSIATVGLVMLGGVLLFLLAMRSRIRERIRTLGREAAKRGMSDYSPTIEVALLTLLSAGIIPLILLTMAWQIRGHSDQGDFPFAVAEALTACALVLFPLDLFRESGRHLGLAESHFYWPPGAINHFVRAIWWFRLLGVPLTFFAAMAHAHHPRDGGGVAERLLFLAGMLLVSVSAYGLLSGKGQLTKSLKFEQPEGMFAKFHGMFRIFAVGLPLALALVSIYGYHFSAVQIAQRLTWTAWLVSLIVWVRALAIRWIVLSRRRILVRQAQQRREAARVASETSGEASLAAKVPVSEEMDITKSTAQTRRLLDIIMWAVALISLSFVWSATFPAISASLNKPITSTIFGEEVPPEFQTALAAEASPEAAPSTEETTAPSSVPISPATDHMVRLTWLWLIIAVLVGVFTIVASRNLPGLMEISILNRLPVDNATRYAVTRITSYLIVIVGILMTAKSIGLEWQNVQWLAAALTVGLGFGLQEVFANFVSGLILLFERPIRVGDIVTIDNVTGVVSRIRMRATTVTDWDRKEFVVPNKDLITGRLLNWTLSDNLTRLTIRVSIAHGSDTEKARSLMLALCEEDPNILKDPEPFALFEEFGQGSLTVVLRCYLASMDLRLAVTHSLNTRITQVFKEAGILLAVPRRDIRVYEQSSNGTATAPIILAEEAEASVETDQSPFEGERAQVTQARRDSDGR